MRPGCVAPGTIDKMVEAAIWLLVQGDRAGAEDLLAQVLRQDPTNERARQAMRSAGAPTSPGARPPAPPLPSQTVPVMASPLGSPATASTPLEPRPALPRDDAPTARVSRAELEAQQPRSSKATQQFGVDAADVQAVRSAVRARREAASLRTTDVEDLLGGAARRTTLPGGAATFDARPEDSTMPGRTFALPERPEAPARTFSNEATALDLSLERALNDEPPPTSADHPHVESTSRHHPETTTDRHLALARPEPTGRSATQPRLVPTAPPALAQTPAFVSGATGALGREWVLEVLTGPYRGQQLPVSRKPVVVGRGLGLLGDDDDAFASPGHASFFLRGADLFVSDGGSASGTWHTIDGAFRLAPGDSFSAGLQRFRFLGALGAAPQVDPPEYGAPVPGASWRLEHTLVGLRPGRAWVLRGIVTLGRQQQQLAFPDDEAMAPHHADLRPAGHELEVVDHSQGLGTWVCLPSGGERRMPAGTRVRLGALVLQISLRAGA